MALLAAIDPTGPGTTAPFVNITGTVTFATPNYKLDRTAANTAARVDIPDTNDKDDLDFSFLFNYSAAPGAASAVAINIYTGIDLIRIRPTNLWDIHNTTISAGALTPGTDYYFSITQKKNGANYDVKATVRDSSGTVIETLEATGIVPATVAGGRLRLTSPSGVSNFALVRDIVVTDSAAYTVPTHRHAERVELAAHSTNTYGTALGANPANRWTNVNEVPINAANGWQSSGNNQQESYLLESNPISGAIIGYTAWCWARRESGGSGIGAEFMVVNGADVAIVTTTTAAYFKSVATTTTYPTGAFGVRKTTGSTVHTLYEVGVTIAYDDVAVITGTLTAHLDEAEAAVEGSMTITGTMSVTPKAVTSALTGEETITGSAESTVPDVTAAATGEETFSGEVAASLDPVSIVATGEETITGTLDASISPGVGAEGAELISGSITSSVPDAFSVAGEGETRTLSGNWTECQEVPTTNWDGTCTVADTTPWVTGLFVYKDYRGFLRFSEIDYGGTGFYHNGTTLVFGATTRTRERITRARDSIGGYIIVGDA